VHFSLVAKFRRLKSLQQKREARLRGLGQSPQGDFAYG